MKQVALLALALLFSFGISAKNFTSEKDKISYIIGLSMSSALVAQGITPEVNEEFLLEGMKDGLAQKQPRLEQAEIQKIMMGFQQKMQAKQQAMRSKAIEGNLKDAEAFLNKNKTQKGIKTTKSGLQYEIIKPGNGPKPTSDSRVTTHYEGKLLNGKVFDSSYQRKKPATFPVTGVIPGWTEALQIMPVGSKWRLYIHPKLGYGERGAGQNIPPNSLLIFDIELLKIEK